MKITKTMVAQYISAELGFVSEQKRIDETPEQLRHSCMNTGVTFLPMRNYNVPNEEYGMQCQYFYYCPACGKLYLYNELV